MRGLMAGISVAFLVAGILGAVLPANAAEYAPLDCAKARSVSEKAICSNYELGQREARLATLYEWTTSLVAMGQRGEIQDSQRVFITQREACKAKIACIQKAYDARIEQLESVMSRIKEKGPF